MQATIKGVSFGFEPLKHGIAALGIAAALAIGAVTTLTLDRDDSAAVQSSRAVSTYSQADHQRFIEENTIFPAAARPATTNYRFLEQNMLPGDDVAAPALSSAHIWFLEQNLLPEAATDVPSAAEITLWRQNLLPGDDLQEVAPYTATGETDY